MELFLHPAGDGQQIALSHLLVEVGDVLQHGLVEVAVVEVAQHVGVEVPDVAAGPVHVLKDALRIVLGDGAQVFFGLLVPDLGQLVKGDVAVEEHLLQLVAKDYVKVIGQLVAAHPVGALADAVHREVEVLGADLFQLGEVFRGDGQQVLPVFGGASHEVLKVSGLGLVHAGAYHVLKGGIPEGGVDVLAGEGVAALVQAGADRHGEVLFVVAGGEPDVVDVVAGGVGMSADVDSTLSEIKTDVVQDPPAELLLKGDRVFSQYERRIGLHRGSLDIVQQREHEVLELAEQPVHLFSGDARLPLVHKAAHGILLPAVTGGELCQQLELLLHPGGKTGEIVVLLGLLPHHLALEVVGGILHVKGGIDLGLILVLLAVLFDHGLKDRILRGLFLKDAEQFVHLVGGLALHGLPREEGDAVPPVARSVEGKVYPHVPRQGASYILKKIYLADQGPEPFFGIFVSHLCSFSKELHYAWIM